MGIASQLNNDAQLVGDVKLVRYEGARQALAEARSVDEVKTLHNKSIAMRIYAKQAKDGELIGYATEIRLRAERRLGEMIKAVRKARKLANGAAETGGPGRGGKKNAGCEKTRVSENPTLAAQGIDKNLADRARKLAVLGKKEFEAKLALAKQDASNAVDRAAGKGPPTNEVKPKSKRNGFAKFLAKNGLDTGGDDDDEEAGIEDDVDPENYRTALLLRVDSAIRMAAYSGPVTKELIAAARRVAAAWEKLAQTMEGAI